MDLITLPHTELRISRVCLGTMTFGAQVDAQTAARMVAMAADAGVNCLDTANVYTGGESERILKTILSADRKRFVLASKIGMKVGANADQAGLSARAIERCVEESLDRLGTDYLDICYLHAPDYAVSYEETLGAMDRLVKSGKVRAVGISNYAAWQLCRLTRVSEVNGFALPVIAQQMYNLLARRIEDEFLPATKELGVANFVYNPLAGGLLTGKQTAASAIKGSRFDGNQAYLDRYWNDVNFEAVEELRKAADVAGRSLISLAFSWLLHHTAIDGMILGASNEDQLRANLAACKEPALDEKTLGRCNAVWTMLRGASPKYNR